MMKALARLLNQDKEHYKVPRRVQDVIPIKRIWGDGIFLVGNKYTKTFKFSDINYLVASREDKESMFLSYSELLNSLDSGANGKRRASTAWLASKCGITEKQARIYRKRFEAYIKKFLF